MEAVSVVEDKMVGLVEDLHCFFVNLTGGKEEAECAVVNIERLGLVSGAKSPEPASSARLSFL